MSSGQRENRRTGSFAAAMMTAENRLETSSRRARAAVAFIPQERPPTLLGPLAARAYGETFADSPQSPRDESVGNSDAGKEHAQDPNQASPDHHDGRNIITVLRHRADKARSVKELNKLRSVFAKGFHPDRKTGASWIDQDAIMGEANALIDAAITRLRRARTTIKDASWPG